MTLAEARQAAINEQTIRVYDRRLQGFDLVDVQAAVTQLMETPRREGESALPDLPSLVKVVKAAERKRLNHWEKCANCLSGMDGWVSVAYPDGRRAMRRCHCWLAWKAKLAPVIDRDNKAAAAGDAA